MDTQEYWERVYESRGPEKVSWFRPHLDTSLRLIERAAASLSASIIDVGGGASTLVDDLLARGYRNVTVLDISHTALDATRKRLGPLSGNVHWLVDDITRADLTDQAFEVWHDRAAFHFLTSREERQEYVRRVAAAVKPGGRVIVGTFGPAGPDRCSGLDVARYDIPSLHREFGARFRLVASSEELHGTPSGTTQQFLYCDCVLEQ
jgi:SAM-dependent methyltransferase